MKKGRRAAGEESAICTLFMLIALVLVSFFATYTTMNAVFGGTGKDGNEAVPFAEDVSTAADAKGGGQDALVAVVEDDSEEDCCRGITNWELWGEPVKWGTDNLKTTAADCCKQCKGMCPDGGICKCNSWVYCGDEKRCGEQYKQCWLKKQPDPLKPEVHGEKSTPWSSGLVYAKGVGVLSFETAHGTIRVQLRPEFAPLTVSYVRDLVSLRHCTGCQFYRAEGLGDGWKSDGSRIDEHPAGPPYALLQGTLQTDDIKYTEIAREAAPLVKRGMVCLIQGGPDFFIALGDHPEWGHGHTVFGEVVQGDMAIVDQIAGRPTKGDKWGEINVQVLEDAVDFQVKWTEPTKSS